MNSTLKPYPFVAAVGSTPQARLEVMDGEHLHVLGRFFQAMLLNFLKVPGKVRAIQRLKLIVAFDPTGHPGDAVTITFACGRVILEAGIKPSPDIRIKGEPAVFMKLSRMPAGPAVVKFLMTYEGRDLIARVRSGELKIQGVIGHPLGMMSFSKFMAPNVT